MWVVWNSAEGKASWFSAAETWPSGWCCNKCNTIKLEHIKDDWSARHDQVPTIMHCDFLRIPFVLRPGEYIAVEKIEAVYKKNPLVEQIWVYGNSFESNLVAVVVPAESALTSWASDAGISGNFVTITKDPRANTYVCTELNKTAKEAKIKVSDIALGSCPCMFSYW